MRIKASLSIFLLTILTIFSMVKPTFVHAADGTDKTKEMLDIYCKRRDAANVSLEQWYGGKCTSGNTAELIGFGDIVILDLMEKLGGGNGQDIDLSGFLKGSDKNAGKTNGIVMYNPGREVGALQSISALTGAMLANPPASSVDYIAYVGDNINRHNPVPSAYAATTQGFGFASLNMVLPLWKAFRNLTYLIFTLVFVLYGFMIMLRIKISAQAVTTIQLALPRIITTLLIITFSYAIAGLLIDLFYVIVGLILNSLANPAVQIITDKGMAEFVSGLNVGLGGPFLAMFFHIISFSLSSKILAAIIPSLGTGALAGIANGVVNDILNFSLGILINIILLIALLIVSIKIFWTLVQSNVRLIMKVMFAPLLLVQNVFPNSKAISEWIKGIIAELSVFATVMIMFVLSFYFIGPLKPLGMETSVMQIGPLPDGQIFSPPPLFGPVSQDEKGKLAVIGLGMFLMIPKLAEMVRSKFEKDSPFAFGKELMAPLSFGFKTAAGGYNMYKDAKKKEIEAGSGTTGSV